MSEEAATRIVLVPKPRPAGDGTRVRRYRLARVALSPHPGGPRDHEHLKRVYD
jgi:hypothetical protein